MASTIEIEGVDALVAAEHVTIADRIEAGTWAAAAVATGGDLSMAGARADHLDLLLQKLSDAGAVVEHAPGGLRVRQPTRPRAHRLRDAARIRGWRRTSSPS